VQALEERAPPTAEPHAARIEALAGMKGISAFIAIAVVADIIEAGRFKGSKVFADRRRPTPEAANSNASASVRRLASRGANFQR
jgi:hypothetical protein